MMVLLFFACDVLLVISCLLLDTLTTCKNSMQSDSEAIGRGCVTPVTVGPGSVPWRPHDHGTVRPGRFEHCLAHGGSVRPGHWFSVAAEPARASGPVGQRPTQSAPGPGLGVTGTEPESRRPRPVPLPGPGHRASDSVIPASTRPPLRLTVVARRSTARANLVGNWYGIGTPVLQTTIPPGSTGIIIESPAGGESRQQPLAQVESAWEIHLSGNPTPGQGYLKSAYFGISQVYLRDGSEI
jgi:hypothetical protein